MFRGHAAQAVVRAGHGGEPPRGAAGRALHRHGPAEQALPVGHHPGQLPGECCAGRAIHRHGPADQVRPEGHHPGQLPGDEPFGA